MAGDEGEEWWRLRFIVTRTRALGDAEHPRCPCHGGGTWCGSYGTEDGAWSEVRSRPRAGGGGGSWSRSGHV
jgi:hypothetical protein